MKALTALLISALFLSLQFTEPAEAQSYIGENGYVEFVSKAPLLEFKGKSDHLTGLVDLDENLVDFYVDLTTIDTGIQRRNRDMRNTYLNTDEYPFAEFTGSFSEPVDPEFSGKKEVNVTGHFTIHGVEREMEIEGTIEKKDGGLMVEASWTVLLKDHNIDRPRVLFYELAEEQEVNISILLEKQDES